MADLRSQQISLWRKQDYLLLVSGQGISEFGTQISDLAFILLVLLLTGSPAQVGFGSLPLGVALAGILIQNFGVVAAVLIISGARIFIAAITTLNSSVRYAPPVARVQVK